MDKLVKAFSELDGLIAGNGVSKETIEEASKALGVKFSKEYEAYLLTYGIAAVNGHELTGLGASERVNVIEVTKAVIENQKISGILGYVIENDNIDNVVYWQKTSGEIVRTVGNSSPKHIADSLIEFIKL